MSDLVFWHAGISFAISATSFLWVWMYADSSVTALATATSLFGWLVLNDVVWADYGAGHITRGTCIKGVIPGLTGVVILLLGVLSIPVNVRLCMTTFALSSLLGLATYLHLAKPIILRKPRGLDVAAVVRYGAGYYGQQSLLLLGQRTDQLVLSKAGAHAGLGEYSLAASLAEVALQGPAVLGIRAFRRASRSVTSRDVHRHALLAAIVVLVVGCVPAGWVLQHALGAGYSDLGLLVAVSSIGVVSQASLRISTSQVAGVGRFRWCNGILTACLAGMSTACYFAYAHGGLVALVLVAGVGNATAAFFVRRLA